MNDPTDDVARVIVVDDNAEVAELLAELLRSNGYTVETADDGESALALAERFKPHCVMLDIRMPGMGGLELARRLRALNGDDVVLIATTGLHSTSPDVSETFGLVDHYLHKPFQVAELEKVLPPIKP